MFFLKRMVIRIEYFVNIGMLSSTHMQTFSLCCRENIDMSEYRKNIVNLKEKGTWRRHLALKCSNF